MKDSLLQLENASVHFGGVRAIEGLSVAVREGEIVALMGPNGAGKSTALKSLFGLVPLTYGAVLWEGKKINAVAHQMVGRGVAYVPQGRQVFKNLTVYENLELGGYSIPDRTKVVSNIERTLDFFPALRTKLTQKAGFLSGGQQQMLTIGRGLVSDPKIMLLDEPSLGLAPKVVKEVFEKVREIGSARGVGIMIVEHSIESVLSVAHHAYVLSHGKVAFAGDAKDLKASGQLEKVFLAA